ncbi:hypothetical protein [Anaerolentibacter hominis]|uniref:hypothetical protein n=1 Tax=Anaerolentibacter hominis TaxID=3079009 RepID=UPI0031B87878
MRDTIKSRFYTISRLLIIILLPMAGKLKIPYIVFLSVTILCFGLGLIFYTRSYEDYKKDLGFWEKVVFSVIFVILLIVKREMVCVF